MLAITRRGRSPGPGRPGVHWGAFCPDSSHGPAPGPPPSMKMGRAARRLSDSNSRVSGYFPPHSPGRGRPLRPGSPRQSGQALVSGAAGRSELTDGPDDCVADGPRPLTNPRDVAALPLWVDLDALGPASTTTPSW